MDVGEQIRLLQSQGETIIGFFSGMSLEQARWRPAPDKWSALEILNHLCDEERDDFRARLAATIEDPSLDWDPFDPETMVHKRKYNDLLLETSLKDFRNERAISLEWLRSLSKPVWTNAYRHPQYGEIQAGDILVAWTAHDLLHIRQITNTRLAWVEATSGPYSTRYATP